MLVTTGGQSTCIPGFCGQVRGPCSQGLMWGKEEREGGGVGWVAEAPPGGGKQG